MRPEIDLPYRERIKPNVRLDLKRPTTQGGDAGHKAALQKTVFSSILPR
jgi:hypothetical protein